jgi:hypothetical protein
MSIQANYLNALFQRDWHIQTAREFASLGHCEELATQSVRRARMWNWRLIKLKRRLK